MRKSKQGIKKGQGAVAEETLKHDLYQLKWAIGDTYWTYTKKQTLECFELILEKGARFECRIEDGERFWADEQWEHIKCENDNWAAEHLENIKELK